MLWFSEANNIKDNLVVYYLTSCPNSLSACWLLMPYMNEFTHIKHWLLPDIRVNRVSTLRCYNLSENGRLLVLMPYITRTMDEQTFSRNATLLARNSLLFFWWLLFVCSSQWCRGGNISYYLPCFLYEGITHDASVWFSN
jgi:hypothetical protein